MVVFLTIVSLLQKTLQGSFLRVTIFSLFFSFLFIGMNTVQAADSTKIIPPKVTIPVELPPREFTLGYGQLNSSRSQLDSKFDPKSSGDTRWRFDLLPNLPVIAGWTNQHVCPSKYYALFYYALVDSARPVSSSSQNLSGSIVWCQSSPGQFAAPYNPTYIAYGHVENHTTGGSSNERAYLNFTVTCIQCPTSGCPSRGACAAGYGVASNLVLPEHT